MEVREAQKEWEAGAMADDFDWRDEVPEAWVPLIEADEWLRESFDEFADRYEPVPEFLIQDLRGGELERLRPICALYGEPGLQLLAGLLEIEEASRETAQIETPNGVAYAGYFFAPYQDSPESQQAAAAAAYAYIKQVNRIYKEEFGEPAPLDEDARIEISLGEAGRALAEEMHRAWVHNEDIPDVDIGRGLREWFMELPMREDCAELGMMLSEALYHIDNDYLLADYLQWPLTGRQDENPFLPHYLLWKMGLRIFFPSRERVVLTR